MPSDSSRNWALLAHLSAIPAMVVAMAFLGPLIVYVVKPDDPFVRSQAAEALNFQLSVLLYLAIWIVSLFLLIGLALIPVVIVAAVAWIVLVIVAAVAAGRGEAYRYPLTIRFVKP